MSPGRAGLLVLLGAVSFLDRWPALQAQFARPIVIGTAAGAILGDVVGGAFWGAVFEAVYLGLMPVGAARLPDPGLAALVGTTVALVGERAGIWPAGYAVFAAWAAGEVGEFVDRLARRLNGRIAARARAAVEAGDLGAPGRAVAGALGGGFAIGAAEAALLLWAALAGLRVVEGTAWTGALGGGAVRSVALAAGAAAGIRLFARRGIPLVAFGAGAVAAAAVTWRLVVG